MQISQPKSANRESTSFAGKLGEPSCLDIDHKKRAAMNHPFPQPRIHTYGDRENAEKPDPFSTFLAYYHRYNAVHNPHSVKSQPTTANTFSLHSSPPKNRTSMAPLTYYGYRYANSPIRHWPSRDPIVSFEYYIGSGKGIAKGAGKNNENGFHGDPISLEVFLNNFAYD